MSASRAERVREYERDRRQAARQREERSGNTLKTKFNEIIETLKNLSDVLDQMSQGDSEQRETSAKWTEEFRQFRMRNIESSKAHAKALTDILNGQKDDIDELRGEMLAVRGEMLALSDMDEKIENKIAQSDEKWRKDEKTIKKILNLLQSKTNRTSHSIKPLRSNVEELGKYVTMLKENLRILDQRTKVGFDAMRGQVKQNREAAEAALEALDGKWLESTDRSSNVADQYTIENNYGLPWLIEKVDNPDDVAIMKSTVENATDEEQLQLSIRMHKKYQHLFNIHENKMETSAILKTARGGGDAANEEWAMALLEEGIKLLREGNRVDAMEHFKLANNLSANGKIKELIAKVKEKIQQEEGTNG